MMMQMTSYDAKRIIMMMWQMTICFLKVLYLENVNADMQNIWDYINSGLMKKIPKDSCGVIFPLSIKSKD